MILFSAKTGKFLSNINGRKILPFLAIFIFTLIVATHFFSNKLLGLYENQRPVVIKDRYGKEISVEPNYKGYYVSRGENLPENIKKLLLKKEDNFFYYHLGINPASMMRAGLNFIFGGSLGSSTITQQLVKILLGHEQERSVKNKIIESIYAVSLEINNSKNKILNMYANSAHLGNQVQGFSEAAQLYFGLPLEILGSGQTLRLLATLSSPSELNPWKSQNEKYAIKLAQKYGVGIDEIEAVSKSSYSHQTPTSFELKTLGINCQKTCSITIDQELTEKLRGILNRIISSDISGAENGAIVIIKIPENELLAVVGSPNPNSLVSGHQINMAIEPRPIGSTAKPFIYLESFEKGLRPYTKVEDREYKYKIATGFPLYPKNYDGQYRGKVTLHQALSNSLNVPAVKVLEYVGLTNFYDFLKKDLEFKPLQDLDNYQLGIALGGLEMDLLTLVHYFTIFPNEGKLLPLKIFMGSGAKNNSDILKTPMSEISREKKIAEPKYVQLINKILNDRETGVEEFGLKSNLNLAQSNYGVKTGTSRDFHDSWTIGYTPDFVVGVWLGNSENTPLKHVSGQTGAGRIWYEAMELMFNSNYNKKTPFQFDKISGFEINGNLEYGLPEDIYKEHQNLLEKNELILKPHNDDLFQFEKDMAIPLNASENVRWFINDKFLSEGETAVFKPEDPGKYKISAANPDKGGEKETIEIEILENSD